MFIATLIAADRLSQGDISLASDKLADAGVEVTGFDWIEADTAADICFVSGLNGARSALAEAIVGVDIIMQQESTRAKKLLIADMDSTMITVECLDELADYAGFKPQVAEITERAMRGELDFELALVERVNLLKGLSADIIIQCHNERVQLSEGAQALVRTMKSNGAECVLVSGGFSVFADRVAAEIGFDQAVSNELEISNNALTGEVARPIVDSGKKLKILEEKIVSLGIDMALTMAIGDGANDLPMIEAAGLGVAYRGKPTLQAAADARLDTCDLSALLFAQGYARKEWVQA